MSISARKQYLGYFSGAETQAVPFTDLSGLIEYCELKDIDLLFVEEQLLLKRKYLFLESISSQLWQDHFELLQMSPDGQGGRLMLYRFISSPDGQYRERLNEIEQRSY